MACLGDYDLWTGGVDPPGVDAAHTARLPEHLFETRYSYHARGGRRADQPDIANAGDQKIRRRQWLSLFRPCLSLCVYYDRLRRGLGVSLSHCLGHNAENGEARVAHT